jgi:SAM-dependent methyltransferase
MSDADHYVIRGGLEGRERLRLLGRVMHASTGGLLDRLPIVAGAACLDVGCGGGDVSAELARRVGPSGRVVGVDIDDTKLAIARSEAAAHGLGHLEFVKADVREASFAEPFDVVYARFVLTHLSDPAAADFVRHTRPGGTVAVEDIDFSGHFGWPPSAAFERYRALYCAAVRRRGGDPDIGPRLPGLLLAAGLEAMGVSVAQPVALQGETKLLNPVTMENIADAVLADGTASRAEIDQIVADLRAFAADPTTLAGVPRIVQAWGRRPS